MGKKHILYYSIIEFLENGKCPVCGLIKKRREEYFEHVLFEQVNDIGFRKKLRATNGFCNYHTYKFLSYHDSLGTALIYQDLYLTDIKNLEHGKIVKTPERCVVCDIEKDAEKTALDLIYEFLNDNEFKDKLLHSKGLCLPHYKKMLLSYNVPQWFKDFHMSRFKKITEVLHKFIDSENVSLGTERPKLSKEDELIWKEAVEFFAGIEGLKW
jgi:hypothetical protein